MSIEIPKKLTVNNIILYLSSQHDIDKKQVKAILDDFFNVVEKGMLAGHRVPIGTIGKIYAHKKPETKERQGINPATRQPITIKAKPASQVPKFSFSKGFKESIKDA